MLLRNWELKAIAFLLALTLWCWVLVTQRGAASARAIPVAVRTVGALADGYRITRIEVEPAVVTVSGPERTVTELQYVETAPLAVSHLTSDTTERLRLLRPRDTRLLRDTEVTVTLHLAPALP